MIAVIERKPDPKIIQAFEEFLEMAKSGELVGYMVTMELAEHRLCSQSSIRDNFLLLAHLARQMYIANAAMS